MPRSGPNGTYTLPGAQDEAQPNTTIQSSINNQGWADIEQTFNTPQPIAYGGTGATDAQGAVSAIFDGTTYVLDDNLSIAASGDTSKVVKFDLSGLSTATTRTLTVPDKSGTIALTGDNNPWLSQPLGVPIPFFTHLAGVDLPPADNPVFRYIKLTASDAYNDGVLTDESVAGSAPLVVATAKIDDALSPMDGETVHLINTERRVLRAGNAGTVQEDAMQGHWHEVYDTTISSISWNAGEQGPNRSGAVNKSNKLNEADIVRDAISDGVNGTPRIANENRSKNIGATYFMRIR